MKVEPFVFFEDKSLIRVFKNEEIDLNDVTFLVVVVLGIEVVLDLLDGLVEEVFDEEFVDACTEDFEKGVGGRVSALLFDFLVQNLFGLQV